MVTAFVLINVEDSKVQQTAEHLLTLEGLTETHIVAGEYDIVAVVRVKDNKKLSKLITDNIIHSPGVERTKTLFALNTLSNFNLENIFLTK